MTVLMEVRAIRFCAQPVALRLSLATWLLAKEGGQGLGSNVGVKRQLPRSPPSSKGRQEGADWPLQELSVEGSTRRGAPTWRASRWDQDQGRMYCLSASKRGNTITHHWLQRGYGGGRLSSLSGFLQRRRALGSGGKCWSTFAFQGKMHRERKKIVEFRRVFAAAANGAAHDSNVERKDEAKKHPEGITFEQMVSSPPFLLKHTHAEKIRQIPRTWGWKFARNLFVASLGILLGLAASSRKGLDRYHHHLISPAHAGTTEVQIAKREVEWYRKKVSSQERFIYAVDHFFSTTPEGKAVVFASIVLATVLAGGVAYYQAAKADGEDMDFSEAFWAAWAYIADSSMHTSERTLTKRIVAFPLTVVGLVFFALLVGLMTESIDEKLDNLRNDGGVALEQNHTLIIGWSPKTIKLVKQLALSNKFRKQKRALVIMGDVEKQKMDADLLKAIPLNERYGSTIVTREGMPMMLESLRKCSVSDAKSIIVLSPHKLKLPDEKDAQVLQTCLVLAYYPDMKAEIIAEMAEIDNIQVLRRMAEKLMRTRKPLGIEASELQTSEQKQLAAMPLKMIPVQAGDISLRMMVERVLQPGLATTVMELFNFDGCEFHMKDWPELVGKTFGEAVFMFQKAVPCGIRVQTPTALKSFVRINPPVDTIIQPGDKLLVISKDDDSYRLDGPHGPAAPRGGGGGEEASGGMVAMDDLRLWTSNEQEQKQKPVRLLISGWKNDMRSILTLLDNYLPTGSEVTMLSEVPAGEREEEIETGPPLKNLTIIHAFGSPLSRRALEELPLETYNKVMVLLSKNQYTQERRLWSRDQSMQETLRIYDTSSSTTAMYIRHLQGERSCEDSMIVAELENNECDALDRVETTWIDDKVDAEQVQAMVLAHLAEDSDVGSVLDEIVSEKGSSLKLHHASSLVRDGEILNFWELQQRSLKRGEVVVSVKCQDSGGKWIVNPEDKDRKLKWSAENDAYVVLTRGL